MGASSRALRQYFKEIRQTTLLTRERVRQIEQKGFRKLRTYLTANERRGGYFTPSRNL